MVTAVDYLIYSMASAELKTLSEESHEVLNSYKAIVSSNVRTLLSIAKVGIKNGKAPGLRFQCTLEHWNPTV